MFSDIRLNVWFRGCVLICVATALSACARDREMPLPVKYVVDEKQSHVVALGEANHVLWRQRVDKMYHMYLSEPQPLPHDEERVYTSTEAGVVALDARSGKYVWVAEGASSGLVMAGGRLWSFEQDGVNDNGEWGEYWVVGRSKESGETLVEVRLPRSKFPYMRMRELADLCVLQEDERPGSNGTFVLDTQGRIWHRFDHNVNDAIRMGENRVFLTSRRVEGISPEGKTLWEAALPSMGSRPVGKIIELPDKTLVVYLFGRISDSGVQVMRLDGVSGKVLWQTRCDRYGVRHSAYSHKVWVSVVGKNVIVKSWGSYANIFAEILDLETGKQVSRRNVSREEAEGDWIK